MTQVPLSDRSAKRDNLRWLRDTLNTTSGHIRYVLSKVAFLRKESFCIIPIPFPNLSFVGRETELEEIHRRFRERRADAPVHRQALTGLRGIGKTQIALKYVHRYGWEYRGGVLWIRMAPEKSHTEDLQQVVERLQLPVLAQGDLGRRKAIKQWLEEHKNWLLVLDQCDDDDRGSDNTQEDAITNKVQELLPIGERGDVLIVTSRKSLVNHFITHSLSIGPLERQDAVDFLLQRSNWEEMLERLSETEHEAELKAAQKIVWHMGYLPAAISLAGEDIHTGRLVRNLRSYLELYENDGEKIRKHYRTSLADADLSWLHSFEAMQEKDLLAAELLYFCALLAPDAIPIAIIEAGAAVLSAAAENPVQDRAAHRAIHRLYDFSLLGEKDVGVVALNEYIRAMLRDDLVGAKKAELTEKVVKAMNQIFPDDGFKTREDCQRYLLHARLCKKYIDEQPSARCIAAVRLLHAVGCTLQAIGSYQEAGEFLRAALHYRSEVPGEEYPDEDVCKDSLARLQCIQGVYSDAQWTSRITLGHRGGANESDHPDVVISLNTMAEAHHARGEFAEARWHYEKAENILRRRKGSSDSATKIRLAAVLHNQGKLYADWGVLDKAKKYYKGAREIRQDLLGGKEIPESDLIVTQSNLADVYRQEGDPSKHIRDEVTENSLERPKDENDEVMKVAQEEAQTIYNEIMRTYKAVLRGKHPNTAEIQFNLGKWYVSQGNYSEAEVYLGMALDTSKEMLGSEHPQVALIKSELAYAYMRDKCNRSPAILAEHREWVKEYFEEAIEVWEKKINPNEYPHPSLATIKERYAQFLEKEAQRLKKDEKQVTQLKSRVQELREEANALEERHRQRNRFPAM